MSHWVEVKSLVETRDRLNSLRNEAVKALREMHGLQSGNATDAQIDLAGKYAVSAIAKYTMACEGG